LFIGVEDALSFLPEDTVGIGLIYRGEKRFYPFNMLVTREIVNDIVAGDPLLVTYCPLCGTGIVFERSIDGAEYEFGVSGMLWQSNLLMYNRADSIEDQSLWSQVLGEAVVGKHTGTRLNIIPSNIVRFAEWSREHPDAFVLNTGKIGDPYNGEYYRVARAFAPNFDEASSPIDPSAYVYGIEIEYMIVDTTSLDIKPIADILIKDTCGKITNEFSLDKVSISNELMLHVIEIKTHAPAWKQLLD